MPVLLSPLEFFLMPPAFRGTDHAYNSDAVNVGAGFASYTPGLCDDEVYKTVITGSLGNSGGYKQGVVGDGSGRMFGVTADAQQGGYNGAEMDEAMNNDMTGVTEAGYADKIATGIDKVAGDYTTLPKWMQQKFIALRALAKSEGIDMERTFQDAGGTRFGTISKRIFISSLCIAFQHYRFSEADLDAIASAYGCGSDDVFNGGKMSVAWRDFVNDVLSAEVVAKEYEYDATDTDETDAGYSDGIATGIDRIQGGFDDLPLELQQLMKDLRKMAKIEGINLEYTLQQAGGTRFGTLGKRHFCSALTIAFHHFSFTPEIYNALTKAYGCGAPDFAEGGLEEVAWRDFCNDVLSSGKDISAHGVQTIDLAGKYDPKKNASFNDAALAGIFEERLGGEGGP